MRRTIVASVIASVGVLALRQPVRAALPPPDFERDVRPILAQHCFDCHGPEKHKGGLRLDQKPGLLKGGDSGEPAIVPGSAVKSHLLKLVRSADPEEAMPPKGERLTAAQVAVLERWIEAGAHWDDPNKDTGAPAIEAAAARVITAEDRQWWAFRPPVSSEPPEGKDAGWAKGRIDRFVLARLERQGIKPSGEAAPRVLIRRASFDLTGLPPAPAEVEAFLKDDGPAAYERVVDRLLASPRFGERMASLWLPLARYAEDQAHQVGSDTKFFYPNAWKYRAWVIDAFNHDLPYDRFVELQLAADKVEDASAEDLPALGFLGLGPQYYNRNRLEVMADEWEDRVDTVSRTMLGLTVACARCHDHKFDPIGQADYYALAGVFASTKMVSRVPGEAPPPPATKPADGKAEKNPPPNPAIVHLVEDAATPQDLNVFIRGNVERKGPVVPRRFITVLCVSEPTPFHEGSGRRELAMAITDPKNPLTARVMVNRVWGMLTGAPIVTTSSNFGHSGMQPTNQALLDDMAVRFTREGWSIKRLVREIVLSATYRQRSDFVAASAKVDPSNEMLWRMNRRRMSIEQWRDATLNAAGKLDLERPRVPSVELDDPGNLHRTVFARVSRLKLNDLLMQFDYPDANVHAEKRSVTNTAMQKLFMLNSPFVMAQARALAARVSSEQDDEGRIRFAYRLLYGREPDAAEVEPALVFLRRPNPEDAGLTRWEQYAQVLIASNEALYVD
jgi:mono/diheme cytochrome c family protein